MRKLVLKLIQYFLLETDARFRVGDLMYRGDNNYEYEFVGMYYSYELKAFCFMRDPKDGQIYCAPLIQCRVPYVR